MNEIEKTARYWLEKGVATLPIRWKSKSPEVKSWAEYTERLPESSEIERWYITPWHNIGVITGWQNLCILDFDNFEKWTEWCDWARCESIAAYTVLLTSRIVMSSRGMHLYFYTRERARNMKLEAVDVLCDRKYALTAPSIHPSGVQYAVVQDLTPARVERLELMIPPEWMKAEEEELMRQAAEQVSGPDYGLADDGRDGVSMVERIKARYRIEDFFPGAIPSGGGWCKVRCPLHDDQHPSAGIHTERQIFTCFNHCYGSKPLDVIGLYARMHGLTNSQAIEEMSRNL